MPSLNRLSKVPLKEFLRPEDCTAYHFAGEEQFSINGTDGLASKEVRYRRQIACLRILSKCRNLQTLDIAWVSEIAYKSPSSLLAASFHGLYQFSKLSGLRLSSYGIWADEAEPAHALRSLVAHYMPTLQRLDFVGLDWPFFQLSATLPAHLHSVSLDNMWGALTSRASWLVDFFRATGATLRRLKVCEGFLLNANFADGLRYLEKLEHLEIRARYGYFSGHTLGSLTAVHWLQHLESLRSLRIDGLLLHITDLSMIANAFWPRRLQRIEYTQCRASATYNEDQFASLSSYFENPDLLPPCDVLEFCFASPDEGDSGLAQERRRFFREVCRTRREMTRLLECAREKGVEIVLDVSAAGIFAVALQVLEGQYDCKLAGRVTDRSLDMDWLDEDGVSREPMEDEWNR